MTQDQCTEPLEALLAPHTRAVQDDIAAWLDGQARSGVPGELVEAMRYCAMGGGKRLRPALVRMSATAVGGRRDDDLVRRAAVAIELVHTYSLVHDDLPAMDDDVLRRGRPTAHVRFGEAMAILAGDALLTGAMGHLAQGASAASAALVAELAAGSGPAGMIAGQVADMSLSPVPPGAAGLDYIHARKTAALMRAACRMGAVAAGADAPSLAAVSGYGGAIGMAFQLVDDILDVCGSADQLGKTPGKDAAAGKKTHVALLGLDAARSRARQCTQDALAALAPLGPGADELGRLAGLLMERTK
jgi:geranylgeranyl pyrophosphate synthase